VLRARPIADLDELGILRRQGIGAFPLLLQDGKPALEVRQPAAACAILIKPFGFGLKVTKATAQIGEAGARREEELAEKRSWPRSPLLARILSPPASSVSSSSENMAR